MALSNVFREPARELTESAVGLVVVGLVAVPLGAFDYWLTTFMPVVTWVDLVLALVFGLLLMVAGWFVFWGMLHFTHFVGEWICDKLQARGLYLRPRVRVRF